MLLIGFDPGKSTGIVGVDFNVEEISGTVLFRETLVWDDVRDSSSVVPRLREILTLQNWASIIMEDFIVYGGKYNLQGSKLEPVRVIGIVQALAWEANIPFVLQRPNLVYKTQIPPSIRKALLHHERSAFKHLKYFFVRSLKTIRNNTPHV